MRTIVCGGMNRLEIDLEGGKESARDNGMDDGGDGSRGLKGLFYLGRWMEMERGRLRGGFVLARGEGLVDRLKRMRGILIVLRLFLEGLWLVSEVPSFHFVDV